jgi:hypothetical protein
MRLILDKLDEDETFLLCIIALFDSYFASAMLLKFFLTITLPREKKNWFGALETSLVTKSLVRVETRLHFGTLTLCNRELDDQGFSETEVLQIHSLLQRFLLTNQTKAIHQITGFLAANDDYIFGQSEGKEDMDLAIALCAVYGVEDTRKRAIQKMNPHFIGNEESAGRLATTLAPLVSVMFAGGDAKNPISAARKVHCHILGHPELGY